MMDSKEIDAAVKGLHRKLIEGSHILHYHSVLDAYGHISCRHPFLRDVFIMSHAIAPATVSSPHDLIAYNVEDASPVEPAKLAGFVERMIHSEVYKRHPHVQAVVHSHAEHVVPYTISGVPLKACYHMASFLGAGGPPVFDVADHLQAEDSPDMLISNSNLGAALATCFDDGSVVTLMRGHGFTTIADSIEMAVLQAIYTNKNAMISTATISLHAAVSLGTPSSLGIRYLSDRESAEATGATRRSVQRPWKLWVEEVARCSLYSNRA